MGFFKKLTGIAPVLVLSACVSNGAVGSGPTGAITAPPNPSSFSSLLNTERGNNGLGIVSSEVRLTTAAQGHADDMSIRGYFSHNSPEGQTPFDRIRATGYRYCWAGENIAKGYPTPADAFTAWMNSPGHKANMLNANPTEFGLGYAPTGNHWVLVLAKPGC